MKKYIAILIITMTFLSSLVKAHTSLQSSTPAAYAKLMESPKIVALNFESNVRLVRLNLKNKKNEKVAIDFTPSMEASKSFSYALPKLMPSTYKVSWIIMGNDGHKMKGNFSFTVQAKRNSMDEVDEHSQHVSVQ